MPYISSAGYDWVDDVLADEFVRLAMIQVFDDVPGDRQCVRVVVGQVIGNAGHSRVNAAAAERFRINNLTGRGFDERWATQEDRALVAHDNGLVTHCRHVGATGRARAQDRSNLRNAFR